MSYHHLSTTVNNEETFPKHNILKEEKYTSKNSNEKIISSLNNISQEEIEDKEFGMGEDSEHEESLDSLFNEENDETNEKEEKEQKEKKEEKDEKLENEKINIFEEINTEKDETDETNEKKVTNEKEETSEKEEKKIPLSKKKKKLRKFNEISNKKRKRINISQEESTEIKEETSEKENIEHDIEQILKEKKKKNKNVDDAFIENEFIDNVAEENEEEDEKSEKNESLGLNENGDEIYNGITKKRIRKQMMMEKKNINEIHDSSELVFDEKGSDAEQSETNKLPKKKKHFDEILENLKFRKKKTQTISEDDCLQYCAKILKQMIAAHDQDVKSVKSNKPATAKLQIIDHICQILTKPKWKPFFMKLNINRVFEMWLMPITKNSLPHFSIRSSILKVIMQLPITIKSLKGSQLGKVLTYLHTHKDETEENKKIIKTIMQNLLGPIIGINTNYKHSLKKRQKKIMENPNFHKRMLEKAKTLIPETISIEKEEEQNESKRHVTVPFNSECSFLINVPSMVPIENKRNQPKSKIKRLTDNLNFGNRLKKTQTISIDGKEITTIR